MSKLCNIAVSCIRENHIAMRSVDRDSEAYQGLCAGIRERGILTPISVRQREGYYEIIDGLHRYQAAKDCGISWIPCDIVKVNDDQILEPQIMQSVHKIEIRPNECTQQLKRILVRDPLLTITELAKRLGKSITWLNNKLALTRIKSPRIRDLINVGKIPFSNAYALAKLPANEQINWIDGAQAQRPDEFIPRINARLQQVLHGNRTEKRIEKSFYRGRMDAKQGLSPRDNRQNYIEGYAKGIDRQLTSYELLHGRKKQFININDFRPKGDSIKEPSIRKGWDRVHDHRGHAYCRGDVLVHSTGNCWIIYHPEIRKLSSLSFETAVEAQELVEKLL